MSKVGRIGQTYSCKEDVPDIVLSVNGAKYQRFPPRQCPECGLWFKATKSGSIFHNENCQKNAQMRKLRVIYRMALKRGETVPMWYKKSCNIRRVKVEGQCMDCNTPTKNYRCDVCNRARRDTNQRCKIKRKSAMRKKAGDIFG